MVIFDDRRKSFEERFRHEEDLRFKITARSNRLFGEWAATRLGLLGAKADEYAASVVHAQFEEPGVVARVGIDLRAKDIDASDDELRSELARFTEEAERQIMAE